MKKKKRGSKHDLIIDDEGMSDKELEEWEHRPDVLPVLASREFGWWLYRRITRQIEREFEQIKRDNGLTHGKGAN